MENSKINNEINICKKKLEEKYEKEKKKRNLLKYLLLFLNALLDVISTLILNLFTEGVYVHCTVFSIIFMSLFCYLLFKQKIFRHHLVSALFITLLSLGHDLIEKNFETADYHVIYNILFDLLYGLNLTLMKYIMEKYYSPPYEACFWQGFFSVILYTIPFIFYYKYPEFFSRIHYYGPDVTPDKKDDIYEYIHEVAQLL